MLNTQTIKKTIWKNRKWNVLSWLYHLLMSFDVSRLLSQPQFLKDKIYDKTPQIVFVSITYLTSQLFFSNTLRASRVYANQLVPMYHRLNEYFLARLYPNIFLHSKQRFWVDTTIDKHTTNKQFKQPFNSNILLNSKQRFRAHSLIHEHTTHE